MHFDTVIFYSDLFYLSDNILLRNCGRTAGEPDSFGTTCGISCGDLRRSSDSIEGEPAFYIEVLQKYLFFIALRHRQHSRAEFILHQTENRTTRAPQARRSPAEESKLILQAEPENVTGERTEPAEDKL